MIQPVTSLIIACNSIAGRVFIASETVYCVVAEANRGYTFRPIGFDWIVNLGDRSKAVGIDADQIAPFGGLAFSYGALNADGAGAIHTIR